ncbi:NADH dehydrogenase [ubiquinone] 1 beta subcomplex subunit 1 [Tribolium madens]|uniref:NADH dehydrogenase [ubiquinone] 1 beta subcomplex subunit 1 n=1 Tax=Tribolium madens TaxID=41895 RepID=UPI001CF75010|nr:NADH dehydrogenase [ubiquinone] 1 beta subcomplex subunit 1 [Tribolium madens]
MKLRYFIHKDMYLVALPVIGFGFGWFLDRKETERLTLFRDKSALYGRVLKEGEPPSWP